MLAELYEIVDPPVVEVERWLLPEEREATIQECLEGRGVTFSEDGSWHVPAEERKAFDLDRYTCFAQFPTDPRYDKPWTEYQVAVQYDWTVNHVIPCLQERGHDITGFPSRQEFLDTWESVPFYPFSQVPITTNAAWNEMERSCRQIAPSHLLYPQ